MKHAKRIYQTGALLLTLGLLLPLISACGSGDAGPVNEAAQSATVTPIPTAPAAARPTYTVQRGTVQEELTFSGRWLPRDQVALSFEISGSVRGVYVNRNDVVREGDLLADFDTADLESSLTSAQLDLETAINRLETDSEGSGQTVTNAQFALASARLSLEQSRANLPWTNLANAELNLQQAQTRVADAERAYYAAVGSPTSGTAAENAHQSLRDAQVSLEQAQLNYYSSAQSYNNALAQITQQENTVLQRELDLQNALEGAGIDPDLVRSVQQAQIRVDDLEAAIAQAELRAPIDGVVLEINIASGDAVQAFNAVITLAIPDPKEAIANLAFSDTQRLSVGMVGICQQTGRPETAVGCVVRQLPLSSRDADQSVRVAASLDDVALGQLVEITMPLQVREDVLWLPPAAIRTFQTRTFVVVEGDDGQRVVDVELGLQTDDRVEIVSGLNAGEIVVGP